MSLKHTTEQFKVYFDEGELIKEINKLIQWQVV
jgi:hypothetical protein